MKLYYVEGACSLAPHLILEELGIPYETVKISFDQGDGEKPEFKKLNPAGAVPVLVLDDGKPLTENVAILSYLAGLKPEKNLVPRSGTLEHTRALEWLSFLATEVHGPFRWIFGAKFFSENPVVIEALGTKARELVNLNFDLTESRIPTSGYALGANYSVVDAYLFTFYSWAKHIGLDLGRWPKYGALVSRITERPATLKVLKAEDLLD